MDFKESDFPLKIKLKNNNIEYTATGVETREYFHVTFVKQFFYIKELNQFIDIHDCFFNLKR